jgi:hypothetical protein
MSEFDMIAVSKPDLNAKTLVNYHNLYLRLKHVTGSKDLAELSNDEILKAVDEVKGKGGEPITPSVKTSILSMVLVLKEAFNLDIKSIKEAIKESRKNVKTHTVEVNNKLLQDTLPSLKELTSYTNNLYRDGKWRAFIMNWLMTNYGVRNKDLNLEFGDKETKIDKDKNYIIANGKHVKYIRGDYKTVDTFGQKVETITNAKLIAAVKHVMEDPTDNKYLLSLGGNQPIAETSLNKWVSKHTLNGMGQGKIFKVMIAGAPKKTEKLSATRGTALQTTHEFYDIKHKDEAGKAAKRAKANAEE